MSNLVEELAELRESADVLTQKLDEVQRRLKPVVAKDDSGEVTVRLDEDGAVQSVQVGFAWRDRLTATELPAAVLDAVTAAKMASFGQWAEAYQEVEDAERAAPQPTRARPTDNGASVTQALMEAIESHGGTPERADEMLRTLLADVREGLDDANRLLDEHATKHFTGRSGRHVTAEIGPGGELTSLTFDPSWAQEAHPANLGRETTQAIQAATEKSRREGFDAVMQATKLTAIARMATDPEAVHTYWRQESQ